MDLAVPSDHRGDHRGDHRRQYSDVAQILSQEEFVVSSSFHEPSVPEAETPAEYAASWEPNLAERVRAGVEKLPEGRPYMVALVGMPGSGKSISAFLLAAKLEELGLPTMIMPHDGYHIPMDSLRLFPDSDDAIYRRGAPDTFDPASLLRDLLRIRDDNSGDEHLITVPAFDHAKGDPEPHRHAFDRNQHKVVVCEGLYLLHNEAGWDEVKTAFDLTIYLNSDIDACIERVKVRNKCIPGYTPEEIEIRCEAVDRVNATTVMEARERADVIVEPFSS